MSESYMGSITKGAVTIDSFLGINTLPGCGVNEFKRMQNMTTDYYPVMSTRPERFSTGINISGMNKFVCTIEKIDNYASIESEKNSVIRLRCTIADEDALDEDALKALEGAQTIFCWLKTKSADKYYKYHCYNATVSSDEEYAYLWCQFSDAVQRESAKARLKLTQTTGAGTDITNKNDYITAQVFVTTVQSNIAYQDGYFYYVKDKSLVRRTYDGKEEILIEGILDGECRVEMTATTVVVTPHMATYYLSTGIIRAEGYNIPFYYDDVTVTCPATQRPTYQLTIKNAYSLSPGNDATIDFTFVTKDGKKYSGYDLYGGTTEDGDLESELIEMIDAHVNNDAQEKRREFAKACLSYKSTNGVVFTGSLREDLFSKTDPIGYIEGYTSEVGFNPKFSILYNNRMFACDVKGTCCYSSVIGKPYDFTTLEDGEASADWIEVVSAGQFTGIAAFGGNVYYFKENCVHKLYGSSPSDWQLVMLPINGVEDGADKSVAVENDICIYKSTDGFYLFDGTTSYKISGNLGKNAIFPNETEDGSGITEYSACIFKGKYYCGVSDRVLDKYTLYTYDISTGMWCAEEFMSGGGFVDLMRTNRDVYGVKAIEIVNSVVNYYATGLYSLASGNEFSGQAYATAFDWSVESGDMTLGYANNKYISKIQIRAEGSGKKVHAKIIADRNEEKTAEYDFYPTTLDSFSYSPKPIRCDNFRILLSGTGQAKIYGITLTVSEGSEIR